MRLRVKSHQTRIVMQMHDEPVLEVPSSELELIKAQVPLTMAAVAQLAAPLLAQVGVGADWDGAH